MVMGQAATLRTLVIDTSSEACSVALFEGEQHTLLDHRHAVLGRGHAERLVPMIAQLPDRGRAQSIRVALGPGSFTGLRIGLAAARALAIAWDAEIKGYPSLALVAATSAPSPGTPVTVCMHAGHGEYFVQNFDAALHPQDIAASLGPQDAIIATRHAIVVGNRAGELAELASQTGRPVTPLATGPDARAFARMDPSLLTDDLALLYGRAPDAKLPG